MNVPARQQKRFLNYNPSLLVTRAAITVLATLDTTSRDIDPMLENAGFKLLFQTLSDRIFSRNSCP